MSVWIYASNGVAVDVSWDSAGRPHLAVVDGLRGGYDSTRDRSQDDVDAALREVRAALNVEEKQP